MENASSIVLSNAVALNRSLGTIANNIANASTPGYRAQRVIFEEFLQDVGDNQDNFEQVNDYGQFLINRQGQTERTGNTFDVAIFGEGFFAVQAQGGTQYTRAGNFEINDEGQLVTPSGNPVLNDGNAPILIPPNAQNITITELGDIGSDQGIIGRIGVFEFNNVQALRPAGNNLYALEEGFAGPQEATDSRVRQGFVERSNVNAVLEIGRLIQTSRDFVNSQRLLGDEDDRIRQAIQRLGDTTPLS